MLKITFNKSLTFILSLQLLLSPSVFADEITMPGVSIKGDSIKMPGISIKGDKIEMPGVKIDSSGIKAGGVTINDSEIKTPGAIIKKGPKSNSNGSVSVNKAGAGRVFSNMHSPEANFKNKNLAGSVFSGGNFSGADFSGANLTGAVFDNVNFTDVNFSKACMIGVTISGGNFSSSKWDGAITTGMTRANGNFTDSTYENSVSGPSDCSSLNEKTSSTASSSKIIVEAPKPRKFKKAAEITKALSEKNSKVDLTVNFAYDSDKIEAKAHSQVFEIAGSLKSEQLKNTKVRIEGHTDSDGSDEYNMDLAYRRAVSVSKELTEKYEISASRIEVKGFGEKMPVATNSSESGKAFNRRVTLVRLN